FGQQMELLALQLTYLLPLPHGLGTMAGWIEWRALGFLEVVVGFWAVMAASGAGRGDEERGLVEHWLAQGVSRGRYIGLRIVAFAALAMAASTLAVGAAGVGAAIVNDGVPAGALALQGVALVGLVLCCYAVALLAAQFVTTRRGAITLGGAVLLILYLVNVVDRNGAEVAAIRSLSPFWLYDQNHPLTAAGVLDLSSTLGRVYGARWYCDLRRVHRPLVVQRVGLAGLPLRHRPGERVGCRRSGGAPRDLRGAADLACANRGRAPRRAADRSGSDRRRELARAADRRRIRGHLPRSRTRGGRNGTHALGRVRVRRTRGCRGRLAATPHP